MDHDFKTNEEMYICDECGNASPVFNEHCPSCGAPMSNVSGEPAKAKKSNSDDDLEEGYDDDGGSPSLEALREEEQNESDREYSADSYGDDE